jgi:hypothetical protein
MVSDTSTGNGKVVVNRAMSLDGFIAGPGDAQDWIFDFMGNDAPWQKEAAEATGAMLVGRRTVEVGERPGAGDRFEGRRLPLLRTRVRPHP